MKEQTEKIIFGQINCMLTQPALDLAGRLGNLVTSSLPSLDTFFFANSGAEAIEGTSLLFHFPSLELTTLHLLSHNIFVSFLSFFSCYLFLFFIFPLFFILFSSSHSTLSHFVGWHGNNSLVMGQGL